MEGDTATSHQEQISLYGLFGDTSGTLQGLNDHLSPSLLQQSPPCGSTLAGHTAASKAVIMSPPKQSMSNGIQHGGMLLSDLADRSPSAGSITAASLCNYVSYGNQRCTNLVTIKGKGLCNQHSGEPLSTVKKAIFKKPSMANVKQIEEILPVAKSDLTDGNLGQKIIRPGYNATILTTVSNVRTPPLLTISPKVNGIDVSDNMKFAPLTDLKHQHKSQQVRLVKKVGKTITVSRRPLPSKNSDPVSSKSDPPTKILKSPLKTSSDKGHLAPYSIPYYKKLEPVTIPSQLMESKVTRSPSTATSYSRGLQAPTLTVSKSGGNDETIRKLVEVLNGKNMNMQEQLSVLQSMGVTIVQAPGTSSNYSYKKNHGIINMESTDTSISKSVSVGHAYASNPIIQPNAILNHTLSATSSGNIQEKLSGGVKLLPDLEQSSKEFVKPSTSSGKGKKNAKSGQKRKQKQTDENPPKKSKADGKATGTGLVANNNKKSLLNKSQSERSKQKKSNTGGQRQLSLITANAQPELMMVPTSPDAFRILAHYMNEKTLLEKDLFGDRELDIQKDVIKGDRGKALKQRLLKKHVSKKHKKSTDASVDYEQCLKDLNSTDPFIALSAADNLRKSFAVGRQTKKTVHHERVLEKLEKPAELSDVSYGCIPPLDITPVHDTTDASIAFTLDTILMKEKYRTLLEELDREELELRMLSRCFGEDSTLAMNTVNSYLNRKKIDRPLEMESHPKELLCQLSSDEGLRCDKKVLPYANYCKEHIWHCESQHLYKLDQNMKTIADINPEPMVKRVRKRAKLLPLIKKYKKKKKKKVEGSDLPDEVRPDSRARDCSKQLNTDERENISNQISVPKIATFTGKSMLGSKNEQALQNMSFDETKRLDSSDEDLNLMTNEILLSGVLDKLQNDVQDFDLFSEKNVEELERALLLAATSPTPDDQGSSLAEVLTSRTDSLSDVDAEILMAPRLNDSPDAIINCDAPKSAEPPPSLEQFNESQIAHYTFGSSMGAVVKKECSDDSYPAEEAAPPLISAEDLQDLEGVLERLDAEDANSPIVPSSPAMDQYTIMLARQLSQEVEGESLKREAASASMAQSIGQPFKTPQSPSLLTSFSTASPELSLATSPLSRNKPLMQYCGASTNNPLPQSPSIQFKKPNSLNLGNRVSVSSAIEVKNAASLPQEVLPSHQKSTATLKAVNSLNMGSQYNRAAIVVNASSSQNKVKTSKSVSSGTINLPGGSMQRTMHSKMHQTSANVVQNQVVPLTLMQQSQGGNVIKVIVPPGTIINGSNGQQNMLLIPVSALVKSNHLQSGGQNVVTGAGHGNSSHGGTAVNVKPPVNNLTAGQQFFIVNNASAGSSHTHTQLALVQKPGTVNPPQTIMFKSQNPKDRNTYVRVQPSHDQAQQNPGVKSAVQLKLGSNRSDQNGKVTTFTISSAVSTVVSNAKSQTLPYSKVTKVVAAQAGKMTAGRNQGGRRKGKNAPRKPKARFDPVTRKYVPVTDIPVSASVTPMPDCITTSSLSNRTESLIKFNESALSIQNKVQQIDSVLSSLNAAARSQVTLVKGNHEPMKSKTSVQAVKSATGSGSNELVSQSSLKSTSSKAVAMTAATVVRAKTMQPKISSSSRQLSSTVASNNSLVLKQVQKTIPLVVNKSDISIKELSASAAKNISATAATSKLLGAAAAGGTVHWNQTTTAGPEISTSSSLTVPVYITGAISAGAWGGELTMARSLSGATLPVILPARKAGTNRPVSQRVLLSSLASTGLAKLSAVSSASPTLLKQSVLSLPQSVVTMPKTKVSVATTLEDVGKTSLAQTQQPANVALGQAGTHLMEVGPKVSASITVPSRQSIGGVSVASTTARVPILVAASKPHVVNNDVVALRKSSSKASHDIILNDPLNSNPAVLDRSSSSK